MIVGTIRLTRFENIIEPKHGQDPKFSPTSEYTKLIICENNNDLQDIVIIKTTNSKRRAVERGFYYEWCITHWSTIELNETLLVSGPLRNINFKTI